MEEPAEACRAHKDKRYIFDIVDHTVAVTPKQDIAKSATELADPKSVFTADSEADNFARGQEFSFDVIGIWAN